MDICLGSCLFSRLASCLSILCGKNVEHYTQTVQPNLFIPTVLKGTIDFYHFTWISLTWTLPGGDKVSAKQNPLGSFSGTLFIWSGWNLMRLWSNSSWTSWDYFWVGFVETREITAVLQTASKDFAVGMHLDVYAWISFKLGKMIDTKKTPKHFDTSLTDLDIDQGHRSARKQTLLHQLSHTTFSIDLNGIWCII